MVTCDTKSAGIQLTQLINTLVYFAKLKSSMSTSVKVAVFLLSCLTFVVCPLSASPIPTKMKNYTGLRISQDSQITVFKNEQSVAIVEVGKDSIWLSCEIIETYTEEEKSATISSLEKLGFKTLQAPFNVMIQIMNRCNEISSEPADKRNDENRTIRKNRLNLLVLLNGILPGTKWCGPGNIAKDYHDLGKHKNIDLCCRRHDLCPMKLRKNDKKLNLNNRTFYSKSHCICDETFYNCLKNANHAIADLMGKIYFNLLRTSCINETSSTKVCPSENKDECYIPLQFQPVKKLY